MLPIILNSEILSVLVIGKGRAIDKRLQLLSEANIKNLTHIESPEGVEINFSNYNLVYIGDLDYEISEELAKKARAAKVFVNVEDKKPLCDFHVPAIHRSGNLLVTSSTNGTSPRLARRVKEVLQKMFDSEFAEKTKILETERNKLLAQKASYTELLEKSDEYIEKLGIFSKFCDRCKKF
jgi:precorrin-2 dehydrogenase/sirohydrochlorin ferrochelatase